MKQSLFKIYFHQSGNIQNIRGIIYKAL